MKLKTLLLIAGASMVLCTLGYADELRESYNARLSARDHFSSKGERLTSPAAIIRQDRANFYVYNIRDEEDESDTYFASKANRERLEQLLEHGRSTRDAVRRVVNGTPLVNVKVYVTDAGQDYITVTIISD